MSGEEVTEVARLTVRGASALSETDHVATEEPMEIRVEGPGQPVMQIAVTMRTPGHDVELAAGFLYTEGLLRVREDVAERGPARELPVVGAPNNVVTIRLTRPFDAERLKRNFYASSSCGLCGKASLDHIEVQAPKIGDGPVVPKSVLVGLPLALRAAQRTFQQTGGLHATGLFTAEGELLALREDVGRHNAIDKVVGRCFLDGMLPLSNRLVMVSGRSSFEIVQKAAMAGAPLLCAVSAPSSLAIQAAERLGMTLVGFLRGDAFNVYTHPERIDLSA